MPTFAELAAALPLNDDEWGSESKRKRQEPPMFWMFFTAEAANPARYTDTFCVIVYRGGEETSPSYSYRMF